MSMAKAAAALELAGADLLGENHEEKRTKLKSEAVKSREMARS